jgi:CelD/BcsL family acetyltransferase involved in cellulose biosynthesis
MTRDLWRVTRFDDADDLRRPLRHDGFERIPFQDADWLLAWASTLGAAAGVELSVVVVERVGEPAPVLVLPLMRERRHGIVRLTGWDRGVGDYNGALVAPGFSVTSDERAGLWAAIRRALPSADVIEIDKMPSSIGPVENPLVGLDGVVPSEFAGHPLPLGPDPLRLAEDRFDGTTRRSLARKRKKLAAKGRLAFVVETGPEAVADLEQVLDWRARRFPETAESAGAFGIRAFYRRLTAQGGIARVATLRLDDRPVAGCFGTQTGASFQLVAIGHDARFDNWSAGLLAIESMVEWACGAGLATFDFTIGEEPYKRAFGVDSMPLHDFAEPLSLRGRLFLIARRLRRRLRDWKRAVRARRADRA